jgi:spoIIIJ-associated protein
LPQLPAGHAGPAREGPADDDQEENVVAVTGDDNSGGLTTDTAGADGDVPAAGHEPGEEWAGAADPTYAEAVAERDPDTAEEGAAVPGESADDYDGEALAEDDGQALAEDDGEVSAEDEAQSPPDLEQESEIAADYIEGLLDVADLDGDIDMDVEGDRPVVSVVGATLEELIGPRGEVLEALQELTRLAVHRQTGTRSRIMLDVGGYRARRRRELTELGRNTAEQVSKTGVSQRLQPMTPFERKVIHDAVAAAGLRSESEGEEPDRRVVVLPAGDAVGAGVGEPAAGQSTGT